eukprot:TRINITY_DN6832_c0_g1_i1.p1 TRINITY_DN6832_c0_g1~~TRINITY_DN6832_c0_g1_i1.p1  ORF type:complete len:350 (-),score=134.23 TRINITY_DN6832_c0_g1_i1:398-1420(-)
MKELDHQIEILEDILWAQNTSQQLFMDQKESIKEYAILQIEEENKTRKEIEGLLKLEKKLLQEIKEQDNQIEAQKKKLDHFRNQQFLSSSEPSSSSFKSFLSFQAKDNQKTRKLLEALQREEEAFSAHSYQSSLLDFEKKKLEQELKSELENQDEEIVKMNALLERSRNKLNALRPLALKIPDPSDSIENQMKALKKEYFYTLALSMKISAVQQEDRELAKTVDTLYEEMESDNIPCASWPAWLTSQITPKRNHIQPTKQPKAIEKFRKSDSYEMERASIEDKSEDVSHFTIMKDDEKLVEVEWFTESISQSDVTDTTTKGNQKKKSQVAIIENEQVRIL